MGPETKRWLSDALLVLVAHPALSPGCDREAVEKAAEALKGVNTQALVNVGK